MEFFSIIGKSSVKYPAGSLVHQLETVFLFQKRYNFRTSEILRLSKKCLYDDFQIILKLSKCDEYEFIRDEELWNALSKIFSLNNCETFTINYKDYYRYLNRFHPEVVIKNLGKSNKVTHSFRYVSAKKLKEFTQNKKVLKAKLHHQSIKSQDYYLKKSK